MKVFLNTLLIVLLIILFTISACSQENTWKGLSSKVKKLYQQERYSEAAKIAEEALTVAEKAFGPDHPNVATSLNTLAFLYNAQGKYAKAESLYERSLKIREKALGTEHPEVATTCENMAGLYRQIGKRNEAEIFETRARKIRSKR
jgi:tetratricopeptide (TPR) repeat protein